MKQKLTAFLLVFVLAFTVFATTACDPKQSDPTVKEISLVTGSLQTEYTVGDAVDLSDARIKVTMSDNTSEEIALTQSMLNAVIDTSKAGTVTYTVTYGGKTCQLKIVVDNPFGVIEQVDTFELPQFIADYEDNTKTSDADSAFKLVGEEKAVYEVGNANKFVLNPKITGFDSSDTLVTQSKDVKTTFALAVCDEADGVYTDVASADLADYVTADNNAYKFTDAAADKYFRLTVSLDESAYAVGSNVTVSRTITFKVIGNGYNVYDQDGLAVMTDMMKPEVWAEILGCTVDSDGAYVAGESPLTLEADDKPLYQYIGNVDWIILHGSITIDADKLPADYFWNDETEWCNTYRKTAEDSLSAFKEQLSAAGVDTTLDGTLIDGDGYGTRYFGLCKNDADDNNNKAFYCTNRVSVSGNYNSITVSEKKSEGGRLLKVLVGKDIADGTEYQMVSQWHLFKMFETKSNSSWSEPSTTFALKNIALTGNTGKSEDVAPQGVSMINTYCKLAEMENIVANNFYNNFSMDNYGGGKKSDENNIMNISDCKIYDTYSAMAFTWRGKINITNSVLKDAGGPLFIVSDGDTRVLAEDGNNTNIPMVTVDELSELSSYSMGTESWYTQLGATVPAMFGQLQTLDAGLQQISGKSFFTAKTVGATTNNYANVLAIMIPESASALGNDSFSNYKITGVFKTKTDTASMLDEKFRDVTDLLASYGQMTVVIKSGDCYAFVWSDSAGNNILLSYDMMAAQLQSIAAGGSVTVDTTSESYFTGLQAMAIDWRANSTDMLTIWMMAGASYNEKTPYIGIVIGDYHAVESN